MKTESWNGFEIRFVEKNGEWWAVAKDVAVALGLFNLKAILHNGEKIISRLNTDSSGFLLTSNKRIIYETDLYGIKDEIIIPNLCCELTKYIDLKNENARDQFINAICQYIDTKCFKNSFFIKTHPSELGEIFGRIADIAHYDDWVVKNKSVGSIKLETEKILAHGLQGVYFIQADNGMTKIGCTTNIISRLKALRTGSPCILNLEFFIESTNQYELEKKYHEIYSEYRKHGEWFEIPRQELFFT